MNQEYRKALALAEQVAEREPESENDIWPAAPEAYRLAKAFLQFARPEATRTTDAMFEGLCRDIEQCPLTYVDCYSTIKHLQACIAKIRAESEPQYDAQAKLRQMQADIDQATGRSTPQRGSE